jgi:AcrR family transcriptional regulator
MRVNILEASVKLFKTYGYMRTSIDDISQAVGLTKGGVYHYIDKKEDILAEIHDYMADSYLERLNKYVNPEPDPYRKLVNYIKTHVEVMKDFQDYIKVFFTEAENLSKKSFKRIMKKRDIGRAMLHDIIISGIRTKQFRDDVDPNITTFLILGMINWFYLWYRPAGPRSIEEIIENINTLVLYGISKKKSGGRGGHGDIV